MSGGQDDAFHWSPDLFQQLVGVIPLLCPSKLDVITFFQGCGVAETDLAPWRQKLAADPKAVNKYAVVRSVLTALNARGDSALGQRRTVLHRVVEFQEFSTCWEGDRLKAKGMVADIRQLVDHKDTVTRINQEREVDREALRREREARQQVATHRREQREDLRRRLADLRYETNAQRRGLALEKVLGEVFALDGLLVREPFTVKNEDGIPIEQVDGMIELDGQHYLVEMKWWTDKIDVNPVSRHLVRLFGRAGARGLVISASGYTVAAVDTCREILSQRLVLLIDLAEIQLMLERQEDLAEWLRGKTRTVVADKNPYQPPRPP